MPLSNSTYGKATAMTTPDPNAAAADLENARAQLTQTANAMRDHLNAVRQQIEKIDLSGLDRLAAELDATTADSQANADANRAASTTGSGDEAAASQNVASASASKSNTPSTAASSGTAPGSTGSTSATSGTAKS